MSHMAAHSDRIVALYDRHAHCYDADRRRKPIIEQVWLNRVAPLLPKSATILDIGCGHGEPIARYQIEQGFDVVGIDASPTLISLCRNRFSDRDWVVADMRTLELGKTYPGLVAWDSFFHLSQDDQRRMFFILRRHAVLARPCCSPAGHSERIGSYHGEPLYHASLSAQEYRRPLSSSAFAVRAQVAADPGRDHHTVWLAQVER